MPYTARSLSFLVLLMLSPSRARSSQAQSGIFGLRRLKLRSCVHHSTAPHSELLLALKPGAAWTNLLSGPQYKVAAYSHVSTRQKRALLRRKLFHFSSREKQYKTRSFSSIFVSLSTISTMTINKKRKECPTMTPIDDQEIVLHNIINGETVHQVSGDGCTSLYLLLTSRSALSL